MDVAFLAKSLTVFLGPFLPYLIKMGEKAAEDVSSKFTAGAWDKAKTLWGKLQPKVAAKPIVQAAVEDVAKSPEDQDSQTVLEIQMKKMLNEDQEFAKEIFRLMQEEKEQAPGTTNIVQNVGDNSTVFGQIQNAGGININN
jgi:hypothetical protein